MDKNKAEAKKIAHVYLILLDHLSYFSDIFKNLKPTFHSFKESGLLDIIGEREGIF